MAGETGKAIGETGKAVGEAGEAVRETEEVARETEGGEQGYPALQARPETLPKRTDHRKNRRNGRLSDHRAGKGGGTYREAPEGMAASRR